MTNLGLEQDEVFLRLDEIQNEGISSAQDAVSPRQPHPSSHHYVNSQTEKKGET